MDHYYKTVTGWAAFAPLYHEMGKHLRNGMVLVEVGSWLGRSAALMGVEIENSGTDARLYCVDPWVDGGPDLRNTDHFKKLNENIRDIFDRNVEPVSKHIIAVQMTSTEAASKFVDDSVDFLMLDGDHSYEAVKADIEAWMPKLRRGAIMSGDDYMWPGVKRAVGEVFGNRASITMVKAHSNYLLSASYWQVKL